MGDGCADKAVDGWTRQVPPDLPWLCLQQVHYHCQLRVIPTLQRKIPKWKWKHRGKDRPLYKTTIHRNISAAGLFFSKLLPRSSTQGGSWCQSQAGVAYSRCTRFQSPYLKKLCDLWFWICLNFSFLLKRAWGVGQRERKTLKEAPCPAQRLTWDSIP